MLRARARRLSVAVCLLLANACAQAEEGETVQKPVQALEVRIEAFPEYLLGFPLPVAVVASNTSPNVEFTTFPDQSWLMAPNALKFRFEPERGGPPIEAGPDLDFLDREMLLTTLPPEGRLRFLADAASLGIELQPGRYKLSVCVFLEARKSQCSEPVEAEFAAPRPAEAKEAARLRGAGVKGNQPDAGAWLPFVTRNRNLEPLPASLGSLARRQLLLYWAINRALFLPGALSEFDPAPLSELRGTFLEPEAALLAYEVRAAGRENGGNRRLREEILRKWPGLAQRLERIARGEGEISATRQSLGVGQ